MENKSKKTSMSFIESGHKVGIVVCNLCEDRVNLSNADTVEEAEQIWDEHDCDET